VPRLVPLLNLVEAEIPRSSYGSVNYGSKSSAPALEALPRVVDGIERPLMEHGA
jgi:hypothetical protein